MFHIVLFEPEIPPNTGNLIRLCANTGFSLHLIEPLGFSMEEKALRRAGLDYHEAATVQTHASMDAFFEQHKPQNTHTQEYQGRVFACSTKGKKDYDQPQYQADDILLFGPETRGLPASLLKHRQTHEIIRIPMLEGSRSLNLSNAVAIIAFEAWRQNNFGRQ